MTAVGFVMFLLGITAFYFIAVDDPLGTPKLRIVIPVLTLFYGGLALFSAGIAVWLWKVMP